MAQTSKIIDVTRTFVPIKPLAFPETYHGTSAEDKPEDRVPVMAYKGHNFLPTGQGYKSFFGINQKVSIDDLPSRCDHIFIFQSETYENILVALCELGIFYKNGGTVGAWVQAIEHIAPAVGQHDEWTFCVLRNKLYCYRQGKPFIYEIDSKITAPYLQIASLSPTFINMEGQLGIFRANGRIGMWDSENSIAISTLDDPADFTPSVRTLANVMKFDSVKGRIQMVRSSGKGYIIYATKSIVFVQQDVNNLFSWNTETILGNVGISYARECVAAMPDTTHYVSTSAGIYKIEGYKAEPIIPEVSDFVRQSKDPIYLALLENRYLALEILDPDYLTGLVEFTENDIPPIDYVFPGVHDVLQDAVDESLFGGAPTFCSLVEAYGNGELPEQGPLFTPEDKKPGTHYQPLYTCWLDNKGIKDPANIVFGAAPCATVKPAMGGGGSGEQNFCPTTDAGTTAALSTTEAGKTPVRGDEAYIDGRWTIERFVAAQTALWTLEDNAKQAVIQKILSKTAGTGQSVDDPGPAAAPVTSISDCTIGRYVTKFSEPQFGFKKCEFWLTRYALEAIDIKRRITQMQSIRPRVAVDAGPSTIHFGTYRPGSFNTPEEACIVNHSPQHFIRTDEDPVAPNVGTVGYCGPGTGDIPAVGASYNCVAFPGTTMNAEGRCEYPAGFNKVQGWNANNVPVPVEDFAPIPNTAFCRLTGWNYTKTDGSTGYIEETEDCDAPTNYPSPNQPWVANYPYPQPLMDSNGYFCSKPFEPFVIPGTPPVTIDWPTETVTLPPGTFLLQKGSIAPIYPDVYGAYVYDLHLKKWGKMKQDYKLLLDYSPINTEAGSIVDYARFGIVAGVLQANGQVRLFDQYPEDSEITYGKVGYYRLGFTDCQEVLAHFASVSTGKISIAGSRDGKNFQSDVCGEEIFEDDVKVRLAGGYAARWFTITVSGIYDINYLEFRGFTRGKR